ncbi:MAG: DUF2249 domain-containing protein [Chitinophagaceae bacterium]|nr:MAG: hypothetical protein UZ11_BCD004001398 [Bacteroidetes bacterium OLB11]MCC6448141.1 DUF2249 domain-containing protein [Chitinophagaceae bacterium]HMN33090.1 DUF2249 domain-containing protein [Chitinophagaceae bacterium]
MLINEQTKISTLLKHNADSLEALITLSSDFKKLRNPLLRKIMASRTTISMASKIGKCTPEDFYRVLKPLGFVHDTDPVDTQEDIAPQKPMPDYLKQVDKGLIIELDVRAMLAEGNDPLRLIQQKVKVLNEGEVLKIINTFEPTPLIMLLAKQGFQSFVNEISKDEIETYFYKIDNATKVQLNEDSGTSSDWDNIFEQYSNQLVEIDVRHLEMPMPMMTILETLETLPQDKALYVHHKRIPVFLLTELKDRNFEYRIKEVQEGEVYLLIFHNGFIS